MTQYLNHYRCPCGTEWDDQWNCMCNDKCPKCNKEIEPHQSDVLVLDEHQHDSIIGDHGTETDRVHLVQMIQSSKDSIERLKSKLEALKPGRVKEKLERAAGMDRKLFGAEAEASRVRGLIEEHERRVRTFERELEETSERAEDLA